MPRRGSPSPRDYYRDYNRSGSRTPRRGPGSVASYSSYDSEDEEGPTLFGSILRTIMAGSAVVAIAILAKIERDQRDGNGFRSRAGSASASSRPKPHRIPATPPHSDRSHSHPKPHRSQAPPPRPLPPPPLSARAPIGAAPPPPTTTTTANGPADGAVADLGPVPGGYVVKEGDCLYRIAVQHGVDPGVVERLNPELAARANNIKVGEYVRLP